MRAITYGQLIETLQKLVDEGQRDRDEPVILNGSHFGSIKDSRKDRTLALGTADYTPPAEPPIRLR
jgi:hypothetical protein